MSVRPDLNSLDLAALAAHVREAAKERGWEVTSPSRWEAGCAMTSVRPPGGKAREIVEALSKEHNTWLSTNYDGDIRFSSHYFNTVEEVDRAFAQIDTRVRMW